MNEDINFSLKTWTEIVNKCSYSGLGCLASLLFRFLLFELHIFLSDIDLLHTANMLMRNLFHAGVFISENCSLLLIFERKSASNYLLVQRYVDFNQLGGNHLDE